MSVLSLIPHSLDCYSNIVSLEILPLYYSFSKLFQLLQQTEKNTHQRFQILLPGMFKCQLFEEKVFEDMIKLRVLRLEHYPGPYMQSQISLERQRRHYTQRRQNREEYKNVGLKDRSDVAISQGVPVAISQGVPVPPEAGIGKKEFFPGDFGRSVVTLPRC